MIQYLSFAGLALLLGFKHSYDADHLIAVANFLRKTPTLKSATGISISWAIGHMVTAAIITTLLYVFRESFLDNILPHFEKIVGVMLIVLGIFSLKDLLKKISVHSHAHAHENEKHSHLHVHAENKKIHMHKHMFGIGIIHGLASNDELLVLLTAILGLATLAQILAGVAIFSIGVIAGMVAFALLFSFPILKTKSELLYKIITLATGTASVLYGLRMTLSFL